MSSVPDMSNPVTSPQSPATPTEGTRTTTKQTATDLGWTKNPLPAVAESTSSGIHASLSDDTTLLNWLESAAGPHILFTAHRRRACIAFDARLGIRDAIQRAMYDEAAHEAQRRGWEYEPEDGTWRKDGYLQCVEEALVATIAGGAA